MGFERGHALSMSLSTMASSSTTLDQEPVWSLFGVILGGRIAEGNDSSRTP